jgi:hypothetical protein
VLEPTIYPTRGMQSITPLKEHLYTYLTELFNSELINLDDVIFTLIAELVLAKRI